MKRGKKIHYQIVLIFLIVLSTCFFHPKHIYADSDVSYEVENYTINVLIKNTGNIRVEEMLFYDFDEKMNGLRREFLYQYTFKNQKDDINATSSRYQANGIKNLEVATSNTSFDNMKVSNLVNSASNGQDGVYTKEVIREEGKKGYALKVYSPITTDRKYVKYSYEVIDACVGYIDAGELYYNFIGGNWDCPIKNCRINISFENVIDQNLVKVYPHTYARDMREVTKEDNMISFQVNNIKPGEAVDARILFPKEAIFSTTKEYNEQYPYSQMEKEEKRMTSQRSTYFFSFTIYITLIILGIIGLIVNIIKAKILVGKRKIKEKDVEYYRDIPKKLDLGEYNTFISKSNAYQDNKLILSTILDLVNKKIIDMKAEKKEKKRAFDKIEYEYYLTITDKWKEQNLTDYEKEILNILFEQKVSSKLDFTNLKEKTVELNKALEKFGKNTRKISDYYRKQVQKGSKSYEKLYETIERKKTLVPFMIGNISIFLLYLIVIIVISPANMDLKVPELIMGIMFFVFSMIIGITSIYGIITVVKEEYVEDYKQLLGLKKYLKDYSLIKEKYPIELTLWDRYLVFASLFGIAEKISKEIKEELVQKGYEEDYIYCHYPIICMSSFSNSINSSIASNTGAGSGGYSGGGSGGGGGGGRRRWRFLKKESEKMAILLGTILVIIGIITTIKEKRNFRNGIYITIAIFLLILGIVTTVFNYNFNQIVFEFIEKTSPITIMILSLLCFYNVIVPKKIKHPIMEILSFIVGCLLGFLLYLQRNVLNEFSIFFINLIFSYFTISLIAFLFYLFWYNMIPKVKDFSIIIVLGAALIDGKRVSRLLRNRLNKAKELYLSREKGKKLKVIVSGGKGNDEKFSEAFAMKQYLLEQGIPEEDIIMEDQSKTTLENMEYSKNIIKSMNIKGKVVFVTNNFHLLRAAMYAKKVGLKAEGIGCYTLLYYLPNSIFREYIAILVKYKIWFILYIICCAILYGLSYFYM